MLKSATRKVVGVQYAPGEIRIILRNILDQALSKASKNDSQTNRVAALSFGHTEDTDAICYRAKTDYGRGCNIWQNIVLLNTTAIGDE